SATNTVAARPSHARRSSQRRAGGASSAIVNGGADGLAACHTDCAERNSCRFLGSSSHHCSHATASASSPGASCKRTSQSAAAAILSRSASVGLDPVIASGAPAPPLYWHL